MIARYSINVNTWSVERVKSVLQWQDEIGTKISVIFPRLIRETAEKEKEKNEKKDHNKVKRDSFRPSSFYGH